MASIDRAIALAEELKKKKKNPNYQVNQNVITSLDLANSIKTGDKDNSNNYLDSNRGMFDAPIRSSLSVQSTTNNGNNSLINSTKSDLLKQREKLQKQLSSYDRKKNDDYWWDDDKNVVQNILRLPKQAFRSDWKEEMYADDPEYDKLVNQYKTVTKQLEDNQFEQDSKNISAIDKIGYTMFGNLESGIRGVESTVQKILGQTPEVEDLSYIQKMSQASREQTSGVAGFGLDVLGGMARQVPNMLTGSGTVNSALAFANFGGGAYNDAKRDGATEEQATLFGSVIGGSELLLNKLLPSFEINGQNVFGKTATGNFINNVMSKVTSNAFVRKTLTSGVGEFTEEYLQEFLEPIFKNAILEEENGADFWNTMKDDFGEGLKQLGSQLFNKENLYAGMVGAVTSGVMGAPSNIDAYRYEKATGRNADTGLTANEQSIVDKEVESRKAELEQDGTKLTKKQITEIEKEVRNDLEKGYISTDTIESTLGGETYNQLKSTRDTKVDLENKINELESKPNAEITVKEMEQLQAYREQLKSVDTNTLENNLQSEMGQKIKSDDYLQRSYQEKANRSVQFEADLSKYDAKQQAVVQKAIDSGVLNNTNRTHDFVDMVAKISADKGIDFDFTNNTKLKESGFAVEGKTVNGYIKDGSIAVNIDSNKALNRVVGHEITHVLEGTELYTELQNAVKQYATTKGEYDSRLADLTKLYKDVKNANVENELTADLVGDYLFTDTDFINNLSVEKPSLFKKVYNEIKHLYDMATAGSKEARELLKVKKAFEKAYQENIKGTKETSEVRDSLSEVTTETTNEVSVSEVARETTTEATSQVDSLGRELSAEQIEFFEDSKARDENGNLLVVYHTMTNEGQQFNEFNPVGTKGYRFGEQVVNYFTDSQEMSSSYAGDSRIVKANTNKNATQEELSKIAKYQYEVYLNITNPYVVNADGYEWNQASQEFSEEIKSRFESLTTEERESLTKLARNHGELGIKPVLTKATEIVGSGESFSYFGTKYSSEDAKNLASAYTKLREGSGMTPTYKSIYRVAEQTFKKMWIESASVVELTTNDIVKRVIEENKNGANYDGVIIKETIDYGSEIEEPTPNNVYVTFNSNQIKNVDNLNPTNDPDIRYSLNADTDLSYQSTQYNKAWGRNITADKFLTKDIKIADNLKSQTETFEQLEKAKNNPDADITIYRATTSDSINTGDWVFLDRTLAERWTKSLFSDTVKPGYKVVAEIVKAKDVDWTGKNLEFVYSPNGERSIDDTRYSLSENGEQTAPSRNDVFGSDIRLEIAPLQEEIKALTETVTELKDAIDMGRTTTIEDLPMLEQQNSEAFNTLTDEDIAPVIEDTIPEYESSTMESPLEAEGRDIDSVGNRKVKAYQYENPEVKPYFQAEARVMLGDLHNSIKGERSFNDQVYYDTAGEQGFYGTTRQTTDDIAYLKDSFGYTYGEIEKGLNAIIEDHGAENIAVAKRIEFMLDERLREGYTSIDGTEIPANQSYINLLQGMEQAKQYSEAPLGEAPHIEKASNTNIAEDIAPIRKAFNEGVRESAKQIEKELGYLPKDPTRESSYDEVAEILTEEPKTQNDRNKRKAAIIAANVLDKGLVFENVSLKHKNRELMGKWDYTLTSEARAQTAIGQGHYDNETGKTISKSLNEIMEEVNNTGLTKQFYEYIYHKHNVDRMSLKEWHIKNDEGLKELEQNAKDFEKEILKAQKVLATEKQELTFMKKAGYFKDFAIKEQRNKIKEQEQEIKSLTRFAKAFRKDYETNVEAIKNKPVFGENVTAEDSRKVVKQYEAEHPEFMDFAKDVYEYVNADRKVLVDNGVISQETADLWSKMYPHYVPIRRAGHTGNAINVPLDTGRTGINAPIKKATGGSSDILPLFDTMASRTLQTYRAAAKNSFGVELKNTIGTTINSQATTVDEVIDSVDAQESLLQEGKAGQKPTFTVFENGEKITFEITKDMYDALKPLSDSSILSKTHAIPNRISSIHRGLLTQYNPVFAITNGIKDIQDVLINSQHVVKTYSKIPEAYAQVFKKGYWYQEYMANGGEHNSFFDSQENTFNTGRKGVDKVLDLPPLKQIAQLNDFIEIIPRLSEYIASREMGRSIEVSMLDAARVTTNFKAGGNLTKYLNRNGITFLNASVQGAMQQVRNVREAKANGIRGWANLATKFAVAGLPAFLLNALLWDDDEEYEELSDYVKQNYYVVAKTDDGKFIRIPKGRALAVIQDAFKQMKNLVTGDDEVDLKNFLDLVTTNLAPSNPTESNIAAPILDVIENETWYGEDLVPTRLQDLPAAEQYDESTDSFSKWLGGVLDISPVKINYLLDQYSGGIGDVVLPMLTPEAESGDDSFLGNMIAPLKSKFTTDAVMNNQNVSDFYSLSEELTTNAKKSNATDEDVLKNKYINSVKTEMNELYAEKREIQNSDLPSSEKYNQVREVQSKIVDLSKNALNSYEDVDIQGNYSSVGDREYRKDTKNEWKAIDSDEAAALNSMGMTSYDKDNYFSAKNQITNVVKNYKNEKENMDTEDEEYEGEVSLLSGEKKVSIINAIKNAGLNDEQMAYLYDKYYASTEKLNTVVKTHIGMNAYLDLEAQNFTADVNAQGKTISGSKKRKVFDYINSMDIGFEQRVILAKMYYPSYDEYNYDIIDYLNNDDSISYSDMKEILETLDFKVYEDGTIVWD